MSLAGDIISGVSSIGGTLLTNASVRKQQKRQIASDREFWNMQNEYNSPQAQMKRLQEAGLNPNLVYGNSPSGAAGHAERLTTPDMDNAAHKWIDPQGVVSTLGGYADWSVKQAQTDNLKANTQVAQENAILTAQRSYGEGIRNARNRFDLNLAEELRNTSLDAAKEQLRKLKIDNQATLNADERAGLALANSTAQAVESVLSSRLGRELTRQQVEMLKKDNDIRQLDQRMASMGIRPSDPFYASAVIRLLMKKGWLENVMEHGNESGKRFRKMFGF